MPTLILSGENEAKVEIYLDQKKFFKTTLQGRGDEVLLPNVNIGNHDFLIKSDKPLSAFLNYNKKPQTFVFQKEDAEDKVLTFLRVQILLKF